MKTLKVSLLVLSSAAGLSLNALADPEGMVHMPRIQPKKTYSVPTTEVGEDLQENRGFGEKESEMRMMNLMMVEGSGYEGMDMGQMKAEEMKMSGPKDSEHEGHKAQMGSMDMSGSSMGNMAMADRKEAKGAEAQIELTKSPDAAKVGPNVYEFVVKDPRTGKPLPGLKPTAQVYMTSMDMGTDTPRVKEPKPGQYQVKAVFAMKGPWALKITTPKGEKIFPINAGSSAQ